MRTLLPALAALTACAFVWLRPVDLKGTWHCAILPDPGFETDPGFDGVNIALRPGSIEFREGGKFSCGFLANLEDASGTYMLSGSTVTLTPTMRGIHDVKDSAPSLLQLSPDGNTISGRDLPVDAGQPHHYTLVLQRDR